MTNTMSVLGVTANAGNALGCYPSIVRSDVVGAVLMRLGNTPQELALSGWKPYVSDAPWLLRTGDGVRTVYAEYKDASNALLYSTSAAAAYDTSWGPHLDAQGKISAIRSLMPASKAIKGAGPSIWEQDFQDGCSYWSSYDWQSGVAGAQNTFYPASQESSGGVTGGHIWTDDSRWMIDSPESPNSVLALLTYPRWHAPGVNSMYIYPVNVSFYLKGDNLDLRGAQAYFWMICNSPSGLEARWHKTSVPLNIGNGAWGTKNTINVGSWGDGWTKSWDGGNGVTAPYFDQTSSWGISFRGFGAGQEPTGKLSMSNFRMDLV